MEQLANSLTHAHGVLAYDYLVIGLGGQGFFDYTVFPAAVGSYDMAAQLITQIKAVAITLLWSGGVSAILFYLVDKIFGLRPTEEAEREGLDINEHGERAYNM